MTMTGRVVHFEIPADDLSRATGFYKQAFGWTITSIPEMQYTLVQTAPSDPQGTPVEPGAINGGMLVRQAPVTSPVVTVEVDDIQAVVAKIRAAGGTVHGEPQTVGGMGMSAYFTDTEGNTLGLWQYLQQ